MAPVVVHNNMPVLLATMKFEAVPLFAITVVDNNGHVNDRVQRLDDPDEPAQQGHHPRRNTATVKPSQFSPDEHDMHKNGHVNNHVQELDTPTTTCTTGTSSTWSKYCNCGTFTVISTVTTRHQSLKNNGT